MAAAAAGGRERSPGARAHPRPQRAGRGDRRHPRHPRRPLRLRSPSGTAARERSGACGIPPLEFRDVYDEHVGQVYGFFSYRLRDTAEVEDLTQQTFERALRAWGRYDPARAGVATWLLVIARNLLVDHLRGGGRRRERSLEELEELRGDHGALAAAADRPDLGLSPDLERALGELGARERELIALRFGGDLSCPEIAKLTGLTLANVQQILSRTLRRMRASLEPGRAAATVPGR